MEGDLPLAAVIKMMEEVLDDNPFARCHLKWTCPGCGQRVMAEEANTVHSGGMRHDEEGCGQLYTGDLYGLFVEFPLFPEHKEGDA